MKYILLGLCVLARLAAAEANTQHLQDGASKRQEEKQSMEVENVQNVLRLARENPATDPKRFPPVGDFAGVCYMGVDSNHTREKEAKILDAKNPFDKTASKYLEDWQHGDIEDLFKIKHKIVRVNADSTTVEEPTYVLVPGEGAGDQGIPLEHQYDGESQSWTRTETKKRYSGPALKGIPEGTPVEFEEKLYRRFGKTKSGEDYTISRFIQIGTASVRQGDGTRTQKLVRVENYCFLKRKKNP